MARSRLGSTTVPYYRQPSLGAHEPAKPFKYSRTDFYQGGLDTFVQPPAQDPDNFMLLTDVLVSETGVLLPRWGYAHWDNTVNKRGGGRMFLHQDYANARKLIISLDNDVDGPGVFKENGDLLTPLTGPSQLDYSAFSRGFSYFAPVKLKWDGNASGTTTNWGIASPTNAPTFTNGAGSVTLAVGRTYFYVYRNSATGHISGLSPVSASTGIQTSQQFTVTVVASGDSQVDKIDLLATADGGAQTTLYLVGSRANTNGTIVDNTPEATLITNQIYLSTDANGIEHGVTDNTPPPASGLTPPNNTGTYPLKHNGRMYLALGRTLYFSKSLEDITTSTGFAAGKYEEAFPASYFLDISEEAETITALLSYGDVLYVGTDSSVRRLAGSGPTDFANTSPELLFTDAGVANNQVWAPVFLEGTPAGAIWLTPDRRVIQSDFNTYKDIGTPIQDQLNNLDPIYMPLACATYVSQGAYGFYLLSFVSSAEAAYNKRLNNVVFAYNLRTQKWAKWGFGTQNQVSMLFPSSFLYFVGSANAGSGSINGNVITGHQTLLVGCAFTGGVNSQECHIFQIDPAFTTDGGTSITPNIRTSWLDFGDPTLVKSLNELDITTSDTGLSVTVEGANIQGDFSSPPFSYTTTLVASPLGYKKIYLAGKATKYRFYRLTFGNSLSNFSLGGYSAEVNPMSRL